MELQSVTERAGGKDYPLQIIRESETETVFESPLGESRCTTRMGSGRRQLEAAAVRALTEQGIW